MNVKNYQIIIDDITVEVVKKDIKNLNLRVFHPTGRVHVSAPLRLNDEQVRLFVISKILWIKKHQSKFNNQDREPEREFVSGESHYYRGQPYLLNVIYHDSKPKVEIPDKTHIDLYVPMGCNQKQREKVMTEWYRYQLKEQIPYLIDKWKYIVGVEINDWSIKKMKTRWGSCNIVIRNQTGS
ncbi:MAG: SprT family zinc-dependent metalloprotease [Pseudomonadota bacterium]